MGENSLPVIAWEQVSATMWAVSPRTGTLPLTRSYQRDGKHAQNLVESMSKVLQCNELPVINWRLVAQLSLNHLWMTFITHFPHLTTHSECNFKLVCPNLEGKTNCLCSITYCDVLVWNIMFWHFTSTEPHNICIWWLVPWRWRECIPHKYWYLSALLHDITSQVNVILHHRTCCAMTKPRFILWH